MLKRFIQEVFLIIISAVVLAIVVNALRPGGIPLFSDNITPNIPGQDVIDEIDINEVRLKFESQTVLFIDARSSDDYFQGHIKDSVNFPDQEFDQWIDDFIQQFDPMSEIITYCSGVECSQAKDLAEKLYQTGFEKVLYFPGGYDQWQKHQLPIDNNGANKPLP